ncbi:MFS transporter [Scytonema sp. UIC 10036]|uniref:MFS transporter n=1 Tax=Scytonema sp. UIC 10036 TaxID=2304196 RepID=UPI0012DA507F|nr:MFS transporter [Scytonema sp. UIC 10036]MUH00600.1 MFS transporter [Scytonema sp. UIC 10036]
MVQQTNARNMAVFTLIWFGQLVSLIGSGLTSFALGIWVYQHTGSVTQFALIPLFASLPFIIISSIAGSFIDRWHRRLAMLLSDLGAGLSTGAIALMLFANQLEVWHVYLATAVSSICSAFQLPAYAASITLLVPKQHLCRANGLIYLGKSVAKVISPALAGILVVTMQIQGVILLDFATFLFALLTLLIVRFPKVKKTPCGTEAKDSLLREVVYGWTYITSRPGLLGLTIFLTTTNFLLGIVIVLATPLLLSFTSTAVLGTVLSIGGSGMVFGSLLMTIWGGPKRLINSVFIFMLLSGLCILVAGLRPDASLFTLAAFLFFFGMPIINGSIQTIFQKKVIPSVQGRVFALTGMIAESSLPLAYVIAGPLADQVFQPLLTADGPLAASLGKIIGIGTGRGIGLMFIVMGALTILATIVAFQYPPLRLVEEELPDFDPAATTASEQG